MKPDEWQNVKRIFNAALSLGPAERDRFLSDACGGDAELREGVEKLLGTYRSTFLEDPTTANDASGNRRISNGGLIGRYVVLSLIGVGGMGEVYLARDNQLDRNVAIKVLNAAYENNQASIERFIREAKAASALNHPNILTIYEIGETAESHFIVSEFVDGKTLRDELCGHALKLSEVLDIAIQTASALAAAHAAKIIHRDIKPENIVVRPDGLVKVLDFGLAKLISGKPSLVGLEEDTIKAHQTTEGLIMGTVSYMSPEQARGEPVDERTDIFSLGVMLYEMIAGRTPFASSSMSGTLANLISQEPEPLSRYAAGVPDEVQRVVSKMLRKERNKRYQTMKGLIADLNEMKERNTFEALMDRTPKPDGSRETAVLAHTAGDVRQKTVGGENSASSRYGMPFLLALIIALITGILGVGWYWSSMVADQPQIRSLAVLPLKSLDGGENILGLGIADALIRKISQTGELTVRPTSAVRRYLSEETDALAAAKELNADAVLEGSVQRSNDRLRVGINLLRTSDGASLWADNFDMGAGDIFTIQDTVALQVASRLRLQLDPVQQARLRKRATSNPAAYDYFMKGVYSFDQRTHGPGGKAQIDLTIDHFKKAVEADPNYALAHANLGTAYIWKGLFVVPGEQNELAELGKRELLRAGEIDPQTAEIYVGRAFLKFSGYEGYQTEEAVRELLRARQINPNVAHLNLANYYTELGLEDLAKPEYLQALEIDPTSLSLKRGYVWSYANTRRYEEYITAFRTYFPDETPDPYYFMFNGQLTQAREMIDKGAAEDPNYRWLAADRAMLLAQQGDHRSAESQIQLFLKDYDRRDPTYHHATYDAAGVYAVMGNTGEAMRWLRETANTGLAIYPAFERDRFLDRIRHTHEFTQFMAEMKQLYQRRRNEFR